MIGAILFGFVLAGFIVTPNAYAAAGWSPLIRVKNISTDHDGTTFVTGDTTFASGKTYAIISPSAKGHSRMVAEILTSIALGLPMHFYTSNNNILRAILYSP